MLHFSLSMASINLLLLFSLFSLLSALASSSSSSSSYSDLFSTWCAKHSKTYATHEETQSRFRIFQQNAALVDAHNSDAGATYTLALNAFADLTPDEFRKTRLGLVGIANVGREEKSNGNGRVFTGFGSGYQVPSSVDWREEGAVTKVKDQGSCGACWSFSATGAMEGINKIVTGSLVSLSEQELIDCDRTYNMGCNGGLMDYAFNWVIKNKGIDSETDYPYKATDGKCNSNKVNHRVVTIDGYTDVLPNRDDVLLQAVAKQPVSVGICGSDYAFQLYSSGIFSGPCSTSLDHAVLIVGYGSKNGQDYWIIKNSWGTSWGMDGYMHMARNTNSSKGVCGVNMMPSYPTKTGPNPPPSPDPSPTKCSLLTYCPAGSTCCCSWRLFGVCLSWSCCGLDTAVCCKDTKYCCPHDYPLCDTKNQQCLKGNGNTTSVEGIYREDSLIRAGWWNDILAL